MGSELSRAGHPMLAALLTVSLTSLAPPVSPSEAVGPIATLSEELELIQAEEAISMDAQPETAQSRSSSPCVLSDEDLRRLGATDTLSIAKLIPGLDFMRASLTNTYPSIRGIGRTVAEKPRVLVDGLPVPLTLQKIQRIEIFEGLTSDSYGSHLTDGVINFITRHSEEMASTGATRVGGGDDFELYLSEDHWRIPLLTIDGIGGVLLRSRSRLSRPKCLQ